MVVIAVIGCGLLGVKIAGELAYHGHSVKMYDNNIAALNKVFQILEEDKKELRDDGLMLHENFAGRVLCLSRMEEVVRDADFIIESVPEDLYVKQNVFENVCRHCKSDAVLTTTTLRLDVDEIMRAVTNPQRSIGMRFLFPVYYIPEVEIQPWAETSTHTIEKVHQLLEKMGKTMYFRSGAEPLILTDEQREQRKKTRMTQIRRNHGIATVFDAGVPFLAHRANPKPEVDDEDAYTLTLHEQQDHDCAICMDRARTCLLRPCCHMCTCVECGKLLLNRKDGCPICRKDIKEVIRVFHS